MFNLPFFKNNKQNLLDGRSNIVALDIGTEQLKAILFSMTSAEIDIKKMSRIEQQQSAMKSGVIMNLDIVLENCRLAFSDITSKLPQEEIPKNIVMGIAGEYIQGVSIIPSSS